MKINESFTILKLKNKVYKIDFNGRCFTLSEKTKENKDFRYVFSCHKLATIMTYIDDKDSE